MAGHPRTSTLALTLVLALASAPAAHAEEGAGEAAKPLSIPVEDYRLDNGLQVLLHQDRSTPIVHVEVWYHVGSKDEVKGRSGFAHLFEHLMFQGSGHFDDEYFKPLQPLGARVNGTTNTERTNYYETVPSGALELALWLEADRMGFLLEALSQEKLDNQRKVVRNERRQRYEIAPYGEVSKAIAEAMYPVGHPYHHTTIGSHEDLEAATLDDVRAFFRKWYVPGNATLAISGDFDVAEAKGWVEKYFGALKAGEKPTPVTKAEAPKPAPKTIDLTDDVQLPRVYLLWQSPPFFGAGDADLDVLSLVLAEGKSSRLYKRLVFEDRIAKDVYAAQYSAQLGSTYRVVATVAPGHTAEEVLKAIDEELAKVRAEGPTEREVERARNAWRKSFFQQLEAIAGKAGMLQRYNHFTGRPDYVQKDLDRYLKVSAESAKRWAAETLDPDHQLTFVVRPAPAEEAAPGKAAPGGSK